MRRIRVPVLSMLLLAATSLCVDVAIAEIYKWVDADGNVHFGDKPLDPQKAAVAKPVELGSSYQPHERTTAEQEAYERAQREEKLRVDERMRSAQESRAASQAQREAEKTKRCQWYANAVKKLTGSEESRIYYYMKDENGESVTEERQKEIIKEYKAEMSKLGCP